MHTDIDLWRILGLIIVVREMNFILQKTLSEVPTSGSSRYYLAPHLSMSSPSVTSILCWKHRQNTLNSHNNEYPCPNDDIFVSHNKHWGGFTKCVLGGYFHTKYKYLSMALDPTSFNCNRRHSLFKKFPLKTFGSIMTSFSMFSPRTMLTLICRHSAS